MNTAIAFLAADWPAPQAIRAGTTLRTGGVSDVPFTSLNLGAATGDDTQAVAENRRRMATALKLPGPPIWLNQVHGTTVADADRPVTGPADASITTASSTVCAVLTADCLPVLLTDRAATCWGAAHAGWRGLAAGVLEAIVARLPAAGGELMAWLGPAIGPRNFAVGADVRAAFCDRHAADAAAFAPGAAAGQYRADLYALARARLKRAGVGAVYGGGLCTVADAHRFYSHRRAGATGRMASLIWRAS
jgi:YfiH family protein